MVEAQLVLPSTAKHPWGAGDFRDIGRSAFTYSHYVEAKNRFNTPIEVHYTCAGDIRPDFMGFGDLRIVAAEER